MERDELLTVQETADLLKVHPETVRRWLREGVLRGRQLSRRAGWRIPASEINRIAGLEEIGGTPEGKLAA